MLKNKASILSVSDFGTVFNVLILLPGGVRFLNRLPKIEIQKCIMCERLVTLNLGYNTELVLTLILLTILTSFDPKPDPYFSTLKLS